ncbi:MAG: DUF4145 domain-containing protein [Deltaproteobacteria bacterium]|nr:DUF4145 domain-containing protein [Deltaproteobacteria bacterium]
MALILRTCLESLVLTLLDADNVAYSDNDDLAGLIELLEKRQIITVGLKRQMDTIRRLGNKAAHPRKRERIRDFTPSATAFIQVARWSNERLRMKNVRRVE